MHASKFESMKCPICYQKYKECSGKKPYILPMCGHSICSKCITYLRNQAKTSSNLISCPTCRKSAYPKSFHAFEQFSVNYALLEAIENISKLKTAIKSVYGNLCPVHDHSLNLLCLDPSCQMKALNCFKCTVSQHKNCEHDFQLELAQAKDRLTFVSYSIQANEFEAFLSEEIAKFKKITLEKLDKLYADFLSQAKTKFYSLTFEDLLLNKGLYSIKIRKYRSNAGCRASHAEENQQGENGISCKNNEKNSLISVEKWYKRYLSYFSSNKRIYKSRVKKSDLCADLEISPANKTQIETLFNKEKISEMIRSATESENFSAISSALKDYISGFDEKKIDNGI
jgi:hypothetical protein